MRPSWITRLARPGLADLSALVVLAVVALAGLTGHTTPLLFMSVDGLPHSSERLHLAHDLVAALEDLGDDRVVTAGLGVKTADISSFVLRSYEAKTGDLISEDEFDLSVDPDTAEAVAAGGGRVYAIGSGLTTAGTLSLLVRAYDARTGELLWIDELNPAANPRHQTKSRQTGPSGAWLMQAFDPPQSHSLFTVRATDKESGQVLWQDEFLPSEEDLRDGAAPGSAGQDQPGPRDFSLVVRTYEDPTNKLLWEDRFDPVAREERLRENEADLDPFIPLDTAESFDVVLHNPALTGIRPE